ncbi:MAG: hypothetical protein ERJ68_01190 [Aphanocapsa feldmannii 277cI]|uniref:Uncharacterized protein n=1 Tax=Aphanocapsa feldmannii 277cI TaxID=2507554 RepID=A0A524RVE9_9CHRO|nr:MAG: hypothetical protein ERJ68_01190 [Aphanocapsa feldmannii 277cI]
MARPRHRAVVHRVARSQAAGGLVAPDDRTADQGLTLGELLLILVVVAVAIAGAWLSFRGQSSEDDSSRLQHASEERLA